MARKRKRNTSAPPAPVAAPDGNAEPRPSDAAEVETPEVETRQVETPEVSPTPETVDLEAAVELGGPDEEEAEEPEPVVVASPEAEAAQPVVPQESKPVAVDADEPEPVVVASPEAEAAQPVVPQQPEPVVVQQPEPVVVQEPEPVVVQEPEPVAAALQEAEAVEPMLPQEPQPVVVQQPEPVVVQEPEPVAVDADEPEPATRQAEGAAPTAIDTPEREPVEPPSTESPARAHVDDVHHGGPPASSSAAEPTTGPSTAEEAGTAAYEGGLGADASEPAAVPADEPAQAGDERGPVEGWAAWRRLFLMGRPRSTKANLLGALLAIALGIGIGTQVQLTNQRGLSELSQSDLVRVLDDISLRSSRLDDQIRELEATRDRLKNGTGSTAEALAQAQKRVDTLGILAGTVAAQGPGIGLTISDPDKKVSGPLILDLIQELRDAGAEAIDVGGVRVVGSSFVGDSDGTILIDGTEVPRPIMIKAIGDPKTLSSAMTIPGGIVETVRQKGAKATVTELGSTEITSLHSAPEPTNATPSP